MYAAGDSARNKTKTPLYGHTLLQTPVWEDPYVGTCRERGETILVLTWWCFAVFASDVLTLLNLATSPLELRWYK